MTNKELAKENLRLRNRLNAKESVNTELKKAFDEANRKLNIANKTIKEQIDKIQDLQDRYDEVEGMRNSFFKELCKSSKNNKKLITKIESLVKTIKILSR